MRKPPVWKPPLFIPVILSLKLKRSRMTSEDALHLFCKEQLMKKNKFATSLNSTAFHTGTANTLVLMITVTTIFLPEVIRAILAPEPETQLVTQLATLMTDVFSALMKVPI